MSDWDIVQQLAADFQKLQASSGAQKLSERNCVEVVTKLVEMGLLDILHTRDGKEYVTPQHLEREIRNELAANKGRINVVDLQQILNVDLSYIETKVGDILKHDRNVVLLQGELIDKSYIDALCEEVNETLQEVGQVAVSDLSKNFGLPNDFLIEHIEASVGTRIKGQLDKSGSGAIYTDAFVSRYVSRIRGLLSAITRPTAIGPLIAKGSFQEKLFLTVLHDLVSKGVLAGSLHGHMEKAVYVPNVYTRMQNRWADSFLASNGYLEFDALSRLGIENPQAFVAQRYSSQEDVIELVTCVVGDGVMTELGARLEESLATDGWVDVLPLLPAPCTAEDAELLVQKKYSSDLELKVLGGFLIRRRFIQTCYDHFQSNIHEKAHKAATTDTARVSEMIQRSLEDDQVKTSSRKKGGREKKGDKGRVRKGSDSQEAIRRTGSGRWDILFMTSEEISAALLEKYPDCSETVVNDIAMDIINPLQMAFQEEVKTCLSTLGQGSSASQHRKIHANIQERVQGLWSTAKLFDKAILLFDGDAAVQLSKYLLRTVCSDMTNMVLLYVADDSNSNPTSLEEMNAKERAKIVSSLRIQSKKSLTELDKSLSGKSTTRFFELFEGICAEEYCGILLKKLDKKKERQLLFSHQQSLLENLRQEEDPPMCLHLITVILFQQQTGCIIHIPGKLVPLVLTFLSQKLGEKDYEKLSECQKLVTEQLKLQSGAVVQDFEVGKDTTSKLDDDPSNIEGGKDAPGDKQVVESDIAGDHVQGVKDTNEPVNKNRLGDLLSELKQTVLAKPKKSAAAEN